MLAMLPSLLGPAANRAQLSVVVPHLCLPAADTWGAIFEEDGLKSGEIQQVGRWP